MLTFLVALGSVFYQHMEGLGLLVLAMVLLMLVLTIIMVVYFTPDQYPAVRKHMRLVPLWFFVTFLYLPVLNEAFQL